MNDPHEDEQHPICPTCGTPLEIWPRRDGPGTVAVCPRCSAGPTPLDFPDRELPAKPASPSPVRDTRLKDILDKRTDAVPQAQLNDMLDDLDPDARRLLENAAAGKPEPEIKESLREDLAQSLRYQGYTVEDDARGVRIGGRPRTGKLSSPYEIVRMAAELDGGLKPDAERITCPECNAVLPGGSTKCQWCGAAIPPEDDPPPDDIAA